MLRAAAAACAAALLLLQGSLCRPQDDPWIPLEPVDASVSGVGCQTTPTPDGTSIPMSCVFPFTYRGKTYTDCTRDTDPDDLLWCSVRVDSAGEHVTGQRAWGYCDEATCDPSPGSGSQTGGGAGGGSTKRQKNINDKGEACSTISGRTPNLPCVFPFRYKSRERSSCITEDDQDGKEWCSTRVDVDGEHVTGNWGHCRCGPSDAGSCSLPPAQNSINRNFSSRGTYLPDVDSGHCALDTSGHIINGEDARLHQFIFPALLGTKKHNGDLTYGCGGTLINKRYVLTAAHCVERFVDDPSVVFVTLGELNTDFECDCQGTLGCAYLPQTLQAESIRMHENWQGFGRNENQGDIAVVRLKGTVILSKSVMPVCLPLDEARIARKISRPNLHEGIANDHLWVMGWGMIRPNDQGGLAEGRPSVAPHLQVVRVPVLAPSECESRIDSAFGREINSRAQLCAGRKGADSCRGDSGGPLVVTTNDGAAVHVQLGIVSYGSSQCGNGIPGIYTRLTGYMGWITAQLRP